jgi:hypothetical protein
MAGVRKKPIKGGKYQGWFIDATGLRKFFTGTRSKADTLRIAQRLEDEHRQIRLGYRPPMQSVEKNKQRAFEEVKDEYLAWGNSQGGRDGRPWGRSHAQHRHAHLGWWEKNLQLVTLADFEGLLPHVEGSLRELQARGLTGKTLTNYAEALAAFCDWCVQRGYLASDPLKTLRMFDTTPQSRRRGFA